jgi:hypothetical protein
MPIAGFTQKLRARPTADILSSAYDRSLDERIAYAYLLAPSQHGTTVVRCDRVLHKSHSVSNRWLRASDHVGLLSTFSKD